MVYSIGYWRLGKIEPGFGFNVGYWGINNNWIIRVGLS